MPFHFASMLAHSSSSLGILGAVVGGSIATAKNYKAVQDGSIDYTDAAVDVGKETLGAGVATTMGVVATGVLGGGFVVSLVTVMAVASGTKYAWDRVVDNIDKDSLHKLRGNAQGVEIDDNLTQPKDMADTPGINAESNVVKADLPTVTEEPAAVNVESQEDMADQSVIADETGNLSAQTTLEQDTIAS